MRQIAIYGKGGIGKSVIAANLAVCFAEMNIHPLLIGCDPKSDSHILLTNGQYITPVLELLKVELDISLKAIMVEGYKGVNCIEIGGPKPGVGCAGRGILVGLDLLNKLDIFNNSFDIVIYDVPGDIVCGGFAKPISKNYAQEVYIVTSSEFFSLYAANNICLGLQNLHVPLGGIIGNSRNNSLNPQIIDQFAKNIQSKILSILPWSNDLQEGEKKQKTIVESKPASQIAHLFRNLAEAILYNTKLTIPRAMNSKDLRSLLEV